MKIDFLTVIKTLLGTSQKSHPRNRPIPRTAPITPRSTIFSAHVHLPAR
jgi:hypothetical protein